MAVNSRAVVNNVVRLRRALKAGGVMSNEDRYKRLYDVERKQHDQTRRDASDLRRQLADLQVECDYYRGKIARLEDKSGDGEIFGGKHEARSIKMRQTMQAQIRAMRAIDYSAKKSREALDRVKREAS